MARKPFTKADLPPMVEIPDEPLPDELEGMDDETGETEEDTTEPQGTADSVDAMGAAERTDKTGGAEAGGEGTQADTALSPVPDPELAQKAKQWESLEEAYARNPTAYVMALAQNLSPADRAAVLEKIQTATAPPPAPFEAQSEGEDWLVQHTRNIEAIPQIVEETDQALRTHAQHLYDQTVEIATLKEQVRALAAVVKVALPDLDKGALQKALDGKTSITDAVRRVYQPATEKAVKISDQANKQRPNTPGNGASSIPHISKETKSMAAIVREITGMGKAK
jgi:hypothetical protein